MNIKNYRMKHGLSQQAFCNLVRKEIGDQLNVPTLSMIENGRVGPNKRLTAWLQEKELEDLIDDEPLSQVEEDVLAALKTRNKQNPLTRRQLKTITKQNDPHSRAVIGSLREKGYPILNSPAGGYYYEEDDKAIKEWSKFYESYAFTILKRCSAIKTMVGKEQMRIGEKE